MPIVIKPLLPEQGEEALLFLQPYESECVNLASEILRGSTDCWAIYYVEPSQASGTENENKPVTLECRVSRNITALPFCAKKLSTCSLKRAGNRAHDQVRANSGSDLQGQKLAGLFALRKKRSLFFCLPFAKYKSAFDKKVCSEAQRPLMEFFESREPFCINGEAAGAVFLRNILKNKKSPMRPSVTNKYFLMVSGQARANSGIEALSQDSGAKNQEASQDQDSGEAFHAQDAGGLRVIQATAADYERLLPLELGYQREEVVPASFDISDAALAAAFKHELDQGLTFALFDGERPIAKARVSACGLRHCMLGGVYTVPSERKKGRAAFLVKQIIALFESGLEGQRQNAGGQNRSQGLNAGGGSIAFGKTGSFGIASDSGKPGDSRPSLAFDNFCLYAKQENAAALALYKSLGFTPRGEYLLVYY